MTHSQAVLDALTKAGWFEGRQVDISETVEKLSGEGFEIFPVAAMFLREFLDLHFIVKRDTTNMIFFSPETEIQFHTKFHFDAWEAGEGTFDWARDFYSPLAGVKLYPIGEYYSDLLLIDPYGRIYDGFGVDEFVLIATSPEAALERLVTVC